MTRPKKYNIDYNSMILVLSTHDRTRFYDPTLPNVFQAVAYPARRFSLAMQIFTVH